MAKASYISANTTNATVISAGDTRLLHYSAFNNGASAAYIRFYAGGGTTAPTAGSGTPVWRIMVPAGGGVVAQFARSEGPTWKQGLGFTMTAAAGDSDTTAVAANAVLLNVWWE